MYHKQKYFETIDDLLIQGDEVVKSLNAGINTAPNTTNISQFVSGTKQLIAALFGETSPSFNELKQAENHFSYSNGSRYRSMQGVLSATRKRIEQGWLSDTRNELFAEIFGDYLEMSEYLNEKGMHIAAAVVAGVTLEERVRLLAKKYFNTDKKSNGEPESVENLNNSLKEHYNGKSIDVNIAATYYRVRTKAAHGEWNNDTPQEKQQHSGVVDLMIKTIGDFINRNPV